MSASAFNMIDRNGDGVITQAEYAAAMGGSVSAPMQYTSGSVAAPTYAAPAAMYAAPTYAAPASMYAAAPTYAAPAATYAPTYAAPAATYAAPTYAAPAQTYAAPVATYAAPAQTYAAPVATYAAPAPQYAYPPAQYNSQTGSVALQQVNPGTGSVVAGAQGFNLQALPAQGTVSSGAYQGNPYTAQAPVTYPVQSSPYTQSTLQAAPLQSATSMVAWPQGLAGGQQYTFQPGSYVAPQGAGFALDTNNDGMVSQAEMKAADTNNDGKISDAEVKAAASKKKKISKKKKKGGCC